MSSLGTEIPHLSGFAKFLWPFAIIRSAELLLDQRA